MSRKLIAISTLILTTTLLVGCNEEKQITVSDLQHHRFVLITADGQAIDKNKGAFIEFGEGLSVNGKMCNNFIGKANLTNGTISSPALAQTKMLCSDDEQLNKLDYTVGQIFQQSAKVTLDKGKLTLKSANNELVYELKDLIQ